MQHSPGLTAQMGSMALFPVPSRERAWLCAGECAEPGPWLLCGVRQVKRCQTRQQLMTQHRGSRFGSREAVTEPAGPFLSSDFAGLPFTFCFKSCRQLEFQGLEGSCDSSAGAVSGKAAARFLVTASQHTRAGPEGARNHCPSRATPALCCTFLNEKYTQIPVQCRQNTREHCSAESRVVSTPSLLIAASFCTKVRRSIPHSQLFTMGMCQGLKCTVGKLQRGQMVTFSTQAPVKAQPPRHRCHGSHHTGTQECLVSCGKVVQEGLGESKE